MVETGHVPFWAKCGKCGHCWELFKTPINAGVGAKLMKRATCTACGAHGKSVKIARQEDGILLEGRPAPERDAPAEQRAAQWRRSADTGLSSIAIWETMMGKPAPRSAHPHDPDDLGRCLRLLDLMPEWKARLDLMCGVSKYWDALVARWTELEVSFLAEVGGLKGDKPARKTYALMQDILHPVEDADPRHIRLGPGVSVTIGGDR